MFYKGEVEEELRDKKYPSRSEWVMFKEGDMDTFMKKIVEERSSEMYEHHQSEDCPARGICMNSTYLLAITCCIFVTGCGNCWTVDGNWKLTFPHCMFPVANVVPNFRELSFPAICPEELLGNKAFCSDHCTVAEKHGCPTNIRSFVKFQKAISSGN